MAAGKMEVRCKDCAFRRIVPVDGERKPADVVIEHGRDRSHVLSVSELK